MKALQILKEVSLNNKWLEENGFFFVDRKIKEAIKELEYLKERILHLESIETDMIIKENRSCGNCEDFDNEMDCDSFGFCTNNENNKDYGGYDSIRTRDNFCCNKWKNKQ